MLRVGEIRNKREEGVVLREGKDCGTKRGEGGRSETGTLALREGVIPREDGGR